MNKRVHTDFVKTYKWFAWYPVRTIDGKWILWNYLNKTVDDRPVEYQGLLPYITYEELDG